MAIAENATARLPTTVFGMTSEKAVRWNLADDTVGRLTADPLSWFDAEHDALVGAVRLAADAGLAQAAWGLAAAFVPYFDLRCHFDAWQHTHRIALAAARLAEDLDGEAAMLRGLAQVCLYQDRYAESARMFRRSRAIFRELGDTRGEATSICGLGAVNQFCGGHPVALEYFRKALAMFLAIGDQGGEAYARQAIGRVCLESGDPAQASTWLGQALRLARELGDPTGRGRCPCSSGGCTTWPPTRTRRCASRGTRWTSSRASATATAGPTPCGAWAGSRWSAVTGRTPRPSWSDL